MSQQFLSKYFKRSGDTVGDPPAASDDSKVRILKHYKLHIFDS